MKDFMDKDFLLESDTAKTLFHSYAAKMPIIDYHCHINPEQIANNHQFRNITEAWLGGDHYKWRMIRSNGVDEKLITGSESSDYEKFEQFARTLPRAIGNPLYHWTHLELQRYFGITKTLSEKTCREIWDQCNAKLATDDFRVQAIIKRSNVKLVCTTDDPGDTLEWHQKLAADPNSVCKVLPAWRPDKAMKIEKPGFADYVTHIANITGRPISSCEDFFAALDERMKFFNDMGCKASDHGVDYAYCRIVSKDKLEAIFQKGLQGETLSPSEIEAYKSMILVHLAKGYSKYGWVMQMHYGAIRDPNSDMFAKLGADTGFDCIDNNACAYGITTLMNELLKNNSLPKMIWYSLNPCDNAIIGAAIGSFQGTVTPGMIQQGSAWWFNDSYHGMIDQMTSLASLSILGNFVGMLTDSRSFLSYTRHEYFRRIMCNLIGSWVERGMYPADIEFLGQLVQDISFNNANRYFGFGL
ncbi:MAG: glucuronate isomerase [Candidatus Anaerobiospirillum merdipullorum]|uniref:Uronate isomerase n=1 Tax=Candidatus Anaerobiospirillum merdipullorum TaxID=2838450 RepID=A0A9E2KNE7_9GAMM|nr:glucuronate isomerase [Candidatus Anaerobiospirillum merdipullorum]